MTYEQLHLVEIIIIIIGTAALIGLIYLAYLANKIGATPANYEIKSGMFQLGGYTQAELKEDGVTLSYPIAGYKSIQIRLELWSNDAIFYEILDTRGGYTYYIREEEYLQLIEAVRMSYLPATRRPSITRLLQFRDELQELQKNHETQEEEQIC